MDATLSQILSTLFQYGQEIDRLRARVAELEAQQLTNGVVRTSQEVPDGVAVANH